MPKRPCPFGDSFSPQMKLHVGAKEVDNGVMRSEKMKAVYGEMFLRLTNSTFHPRLPVAVLQEPFPKCPLSVIIFQELALSIQNPEVILLETLALTDLLRTVLSEYGSDVMTPPTVERMETGIEVQKAKAANTLHQMCLTAQGTLARPQPFAKNMEMQPKNRSSCGHSPSLRQSVIPSCSYCESQLCDSCIKSCHFCQGIFCPKCSLTIYQEEEKVLCLSCC
ncbi:apoptosis regulatory protein Siva-like [Penaeus monodon]|uniref:apoptosis regulatory protein Siva-like n=1 Tax=Penaeus monodon TaxID=6687 RepID=UPI0018A78CA0|nr:apoptosis regulatory protein Siva-like [Penaeus monodon]